MNTNEETYVRGEPTLQAGMFVLKSDVSKQRSWNAVRRFDHCRTELHESGGNLLNAIKDWSSGIDRSNAFACIYAHMSTSGIGPTSEGPWTTWDDLAKAFTGKINTLWLVGCSSNHALQSWPTPQDSPVFGTMLVTTADDRWDHLAVAFSIEIELRNPTAYDQMEQALRRYLQRDHVEYYSASQSEWRRLDGSTEFVSPIPGHELSAGLSMRITISYKNSLSFVADILNADGDIVGELETTETKGIRGSDGLRRPTRIFWELKTKTKDVVASGEIAVADWNEMDGATGTI